MIIRNILKKVKNERIKEFIIVGLGAGLSIGLITGLIAGLGAGLITGLITGIIAGLSIGLIIRLITGLSIGLITGLSIGLITGLGAGLGALITNQYLFSLNWVGWLIGFSIVLVIAEIFYLLTDYEINKKTSLWNILLYQLENIFEVLLILINGLNLIWLFMSIKCQDNVLEWTLQILGWLGIIAIGIFLIVGYLQLNKKLKVRK